MVQAGSGWGSRRGREGTRDGGSPRRPLPIPAARWQAVLLPRHSVFLSVFAPGWQALETVQEAGCSALTFTFSTPTLSSEGSSAPEAHPTSPALPGRATSQPSGSCAAPPSLGVVPLLSTCSSPLRAVASWLCAAPAAPRPPLTPPPRHQGPGALPFPLYLPMPVSDVKATMALQQSLPSLALQR